MRTPGELTGTGEGNLWAFAATVEGDVITQLDRLTGARSTTYHPGLSGAWARAIAFWGGDFYLFVSIHANVASTIYRFNTRTGRLTELGPVTGNVAVGAGVSTCAPYELF